jgi:Mlc titration factor MtfA (ptsG expression regulator)
MFGFFRNRRRRKLLAEPFSPYWESILRRNVGHYSRLSAEQQATLRDLTRIFIDEKSFEGCGGQHITEEIKVTIAAQACLLLLGMDHELYNRVPTIIVYPNEFQTPRPEDNWEDDNLSDNYAEGQAVYRGPVILGWKYVLEEGRDPHHSGHNVVLHEFAHQLDYLDAATDGTPPLENREMEERWRTVMTAAFKQHQRDIDADEETFFSEQAADNETEFFADATEAFYCRPHDFEGEAPQVFELLKAYYRVDPREWFPE